MEQLLSKVNLMIAQAVERPWSSALAHSLAPLPMDLHWSRSDVEAVALAASGRVHVAVVDDELPGTGGLDVLRRIRGLGLGFPCLLVCDRADPKLLSAALALDVFSVVQSLTGVDLLAPMVLKAIRRVYRLDWRLDGTLN